MRRRFFNNPYREALRESAQLVAPSEETCQKILSSVMAAAGVTGVVSFAAASAQALSLGKAAFAKTVGTVAATSACVATAAAAGVSMMLPPSIDSVEASSGDWHSSSISISTQNDLAIRQVALIDENGDAFYAAKEKAGSYRIDVFQNGLYTVEATGQSGRSATAQVRVSHIDNDIPALARYAVEGDAISLFFQDQGSGVNWSTLSAADAAGNPVQPLKVDPEQGCAVFALGDSDLDVLVEDLAGNAGKTTIYISE